MIDEAIETSKTITRLSDMLDNVMCEQRDCKDQNNSLYVIFVFALVMYLTAVFLTYMAVTSNQTGVAALLAVITLGCFCNVQNVWSDIKTCRREYANLRYRRNWYLSRLQQTLEK